jgi:hypothetical protein
MTRHAAFVRDTLFFCVKSHKFPDENFIRKCGIGSFFSVMNFIVQFAQLVSMRPQENSLEFI